MKQLMIARSFPTTHPRAGEKTNFVENIYNSFKEDYFIKNPFLELNQFKGAAEEKLIWALWQDLEPLQIGFKHHTIRAGKRWKTGDMVQLKVWSGRPYNSKTITITPPLTLTVFDFEIDADLLPILNGKEIGTALWETIAKNDGLQPPDFLKWFIPDVKKFTGFSGQILCWNDAIKYDV